MKHLLIIITLIASLPVASGYGQTKPSPDGEEVKRLEAERVKALVGGDLKTLDRLLSDDLIYTHSTSRVDTKAEFIEALRSGATKYEQMNHEEVQARAYPNTVILTGKTAVRVRAGDEVRDLHLRFMNVYIKREGRWQMVSWHSTRLP